MATKTTQPPVGQTKTAEGQRDKKSWRPLITALFALLLVYVGLKIWSHKHTAVVIDTAGAAGDHASGSPDVQLAIPQQAPYMFGRFTIDTNSIQEVEVPLGYTLLHGIADDVNVSKFVDGRRVGDISSNDKVNYSHKAGFKVDAGQAKTRTMFGYGLIRKDMPIPPQNVWWEKAMAKQESLPD